MTVLWLMRHAPTALNGEGIFMGDVDAEPLHDGLCDAAAFGQEFHEPIDLVMSSPLRRARLTASAAFPNKAVLVDKRLAERCLGRWQGTYKDEVRRTHPDAFANPGRLDLRVTPPGGEDVAELFARVTSFLSEIASGGVDRRIFVVAHNGVLRMMHYALGDCDIDEASQRHERFLVPVAVDLTATPWVGRPVPCAVELSGTWSAAVERIP